MTAWPAAPDGWLVDFIVWRINSGKTQNRPPAVPTEPPYYALDVLYWCIWRRKGRPEPRPDFPTSPPGWAYETLDAVNKRAPIQLPATPHSWVLTWAIERFKGTALENMPPNVPRDVSVVAPYVWSFLNWAAWQRKRFSDPTTPRPANIPLTIPTWCWGHLKQINIAVPLGPPPPPPPPPEDPRPVNTWQLPFPAMTTAWGWFNDAKYRDNDEALTLMKQEGVRTVLLQVAGGQPLFAPTVPGRVRAFGMKVALWGSPHPGDGELVTVSRADGYMPQVETPDEYQQALANFRAGVGQGVSRSVFTTLYGFNTFTRRPPTDVHAEGQITTVEYEALRPFCTHALVECYVQDGGAHFPLSKMMWAAGQRGFDYANPAVGLWNETPLSTYAGAGELDAWGRQCGVFLSEGMTPSNWTEFGALGA